MRLLVLAGLAVGAIAVFAPQQGAGLMRSVVHGFGWGIGREFWPSPLVTTAVSWQEPMRSNCNGRCRRTP